MASSAALPTGGDGAEGGNWCAASVAALAVATGGGGTHAQGSGLVHAAGQGPIAISQSVNLWGPRGRRGPGSPSRGWTRGSRHAHRPGSQQRRVGGGEPINAGGGRGADPSPPSAGGLAVRAEQEADAGRPERNARAEQAVGAGRPGGDARARVARLVAHAGMLMRGCSQALKAHAVNAQAVKAHVVDAHAVNAHAGILMR